MRKTPPKVAGFEDGGDIDSSAKEYWWPLEAEKGPEVASPLEPLERRQPC